MGDPVAQPSNAFELLPEFHAIGLPKAREGIFDALLPESFLHVVRTEDGGDDPHPRSERELRDDIVVGHGRAEPWVLSRTTSRFVARAVAREAELLLAEEPVEQWRGHSVQCPVGPVRLALRRVPSAESRTDGVAHADLNVCDRRMQCSSELVGPEVQIRRTLRVAARSFKVWGEARLPRKRLDGCLTCHADERIFDR